MERTTKPMVVVTSRVLSVFFQVSRQYDRACWSWREVVFMLQCEVLRMSSGCEVQVSSTFITFTTCIALYDLDPQIRGPTIRRAPLSPHMRGVRSRWMCCIAVTYGTDELFQRCIVSSPHHTTASSAALQILILLPPHSLDLANPQLKLALNPRSQIPRDIPTFQPFIHRRRHALLHSFRAEDGETDGTDLVTEHRDLRFGERTRVGQNERGKWDVDRLPFVSGRGVGRGWEG